MTPFLYRSAREYVSRTVGHRLNKPQIIPQHGRIPAERASVSPSIPTRGRLATPHQLRKDNLNIARAHRNRQIRLESREDGPLKGQDQASLQQVA